MNTAEDRNTSAQIYEYIESQPEGKRRDMSTLHEMIRAQYPEVKLWFLDGKNSEHKTVSNPNIGYGEYTIKYAGGKTKEFYRVGLSANTSGISVYIMGITDKTYLARSYGNSIGKALVSAYCIKFKSLREIDITVLQSAVRDGFNLRD